MAANMETSNLDIRNIDFANKQLDNFLLDEAAYRRLVLSSAAHRFCMNQAYVTLQKLEVVPPFWKSEQNELVKDAFREAGEWEPGVGGIRRNEIAKTILVLNHVAAKRLEATVGVDN